MFNYTAKDFLFIHNEVVPSLNSSKFFKKFKLEAVPFIGTLAGALTFCVAKKIDVDHCIKKDIKAGISYHGKFKGVNFERCNNYLGKYIFQIDIDTESALSWDDYWIHIYPEKNSQNYFIYLDNYFYINNKVGGKFFIKKIPNNLGDRLLNFIEFIYTGKKIRTLTVEDNLELFKISNIFEIRKYDDVLLRYLEIYKDWCRLNDKKIYDKKDNLITHKEFVKEDHY